ncbi:MAG: CRISPR-associated endoribonuclease Cas6 [Candidatus Aenigmatarchaeota archaeon]
MRVKIKLKAVENNLLPHGYNKYISAMLYNKIKSYDEKFFKKLHDDGYLSKLHKYKMFTFSSLKGRILKHNQDGILFEPEVHLYVSSPIIRVIEAIKNGIKLDNKVRIHNTHFECVNIERVQEPVVKKSPVIFKTISPIVASTKSDTGKKVYLTPQDSDFSRVLAKNLIRKSKLLKMSIDEEKALREVKVVPYDMMKIGAIDLYGGRITYSKGLFVYYGPAELFNVAYRAGFGERNAQGFGMIEIL